MSDLALKKWIAPALWLLVTAFIQVLLITFEFNAVRKQLNDEASYLYDSVYDRSRVNEVLLESFSALTAVHVDNEDPLRRFSSSVRAKYPHIERLQIHNSGNGPDGGFPLTFLDPLNADTRYLLNARSLSASQATALQSSVKHHGPAASPPFLLDDGRSVYTLYQPVNALSRDTPRVVSLIVSYQGLLPPASLLESNRRFDLIGPTGDILLSQGASPRYTLLPSFSISHKFNRFGQPLQLRLTRFMLWSDLNWTLMIGITLLSLALLKLMHTFRKQKRINQIERQNTLRQLQQERQQLESHVTLRTQELHEQLRENQRLAHRVMEVQEHERRHLARELHDELGQSLTAIRTDASMLKRLHPNASSAVYQSAESIDAIAQHIYGVTYDLMRYLRPTALDDLGLVDAVRECIANLRLHDHGIALETRFKGCLNEMTETYNITLYRLVQEALTNVLRHAAASQVTLHLIHLSETVPESVRLIVSDNGCGMGDGNNPAKGGFGLIGMRERVNALGGTFTLNSAPAEGTRIEVEIPLPVTAAAEAQDGARPYSADAVARLH